MIAGEVQNLTSIAYYMDCEVGEKDESRMTEVFSDCIDRKETGGRKGVKKRMNVVAWNKPA